MHEHIPTAGDLMATAVRTVSADEDIEDVDFSMRSANVHHLPVLDAKQKLVGIVTHGALAAALRDPGARRRPIKSIMEEKVITVPPTMQADEIIELMIDKRISCVPVLEEDGFLAGILTETDFLLLALAHVRERAKHLTDQTGFRR